ncbi:hypothetical protein LY78DRAFT_19586 [Colletotrichum sublineola]|nr:hypothetical protein LY78DRAFT_19586 [Colletotrichum sublineola]
MFPNAYSVLVQVRRVVSFQSAEHHGTHSHLLAGRRAQKNSTPGRPLASGFPTPNGAIFVASTMTRLASKMATRNGGESDFAAGEPVRWIFPNSQPLVQIVSGPLPTTLQGMALLTKGAKHGMRDRGLNLTYSFFSLFLKLLYCRLTFATCSNIGLDLLRCVLLRVLNWWGYVGGDCREC